MSRLASYVLRLALVAGSLASAMLSVIPARAADKIDRHALVTRHNPHITAVDPWASFSVGNGQFCFTADVTGLQTFTDYYHAKGITTETLARWAWHSNANPHNYQLSDTFRMYTAYGKTQGYPMSQGSPAGQWLRENPHDMPLAQLSFVDERGMTLALADIAGIDQTLDLWTGELTSRFTWKGEPVEVSTVASPGTDAIAAHIRSRAIAKGALRVQIAFPRGHDIKVKNNPPLDWAQPDSHRTTLAAARLRGFYAFQRDRDDFHYGAAMQVTRGGMALENGPHTWILTGNPGSETFDVACRFTPDKPAESVEDWSAMKTASARHWEEYWRSGGAIDFSGSTDPRASELERRVVLSQYLMAVQEAGDFPPQESGLTLSTWYGKHHTEMMWWHTAHFALWGRDTYLEKNLDWFVRALPIGRGIAKGRDLPGARWPKMIGPDGRESPGGNPLIYWNQPHPIHLAELLYRNEPTPAILARYRDLVQETAECMAALLHWDETRKCYLLGPPLWIAQEIYDQGTSVNPTYELSYWSRGLQIAQQWRERQGLARVPEWDKMIKAIAPLPQKDGKYVALESHPDTWDNVASRHDHPSFLMALGQLPGDGVDRAVMARTLQAVISSWDWETKIWGWDYPMIAMTAARVGEPKKAVDILLKSDGPNNWYMPNGHNKQRDDLPIYLPGNGALLSAVAMMAAGWDDAPTHDAPGFPHDGTWVVHSEGLHPLP